MWFSPVLTESNERKSKEVPPGHSGMPSTSGKSSRNCVVSVTGGTGAACETASSVVRVGGGGGSDGSPRSSGSSSSGVGSTDGSSSNSDGSSSGGDGLTVQTERDHRVDRVEAGQLVLLPRVVEGDDRNLARAR